MTTRKLCSSVALVAFLNFMIGLPGCRSPGTTAPAGTQTQRTSNEPSDISIEKLKTPDEALAARLIAAYNDRNIGSPGLREVFLELSTNGEVTRRLTIFNLWRSSNEEVSTLFLLKEPKGLAGTSYLLRESKARFPDIQVSLFLPAGEQRVLEVASSNLHEGLLGSDFSYNDLRMRLPLSGYKYAVIGSGVLKNEPVWILESQPSNSNALGISEWSVARFYLAQSFAFLLGADYFVNSQSGSDQPILLRQMRVNKFEKRQGVWTATEMTMNGQDRHSSRLILDRADFGLSDVDPNLFNANQLPHLFDAVTQPDGIAARANR